MVQPIPFDSPRYWQTAARLRGMLQSRAVTPEELAFAIGVFTFVVYRWLDGERQPGAYEARQIGAYLRVDPSHLRGNDNG
jgi:hypothetical protein